MPELPPAFLTRLRSLLGPVHFDAVRETFTRPKGVGFRINTLRAGPEAVVAALTGAGLRLHPLPWMDHAFWVAAAERSRLMSTEAYRAGALYLQNPSSMVPVACLAPEPGERVLDLAAAPGSKTLQIACRMQGTGEIAAVEVVRARYYKLRDNLTAQGATDVRTFLKDGTGVWRHRPEYFDRVLLDAPCSSEGRFHTSDPDWAYWSPRKIREMSRKQRRLFYSAVQCLRPGGVLVYSTCSFAPEENEAVVSHALKKFGAALAVEPVDLPLPGLLPPLEAWEGRRYDPRVGAARRILPDGLMEGFFVCRIRKVDSTLP